MLVVLGRAQQFGPGEVKGHLPARAEDTNGVALGDLDGDGDLDLLVVNQGSEYWPGERNRLLLNDGLGRFVDASGRLPGLFEWSTGVALGDVDGDGDLDAVVSNVTIWKAVQNRLLLNDGAAGFVDATAGRLPAVGDAGAVVLADLDGDGDLDLLFGAFDRLLLNDGTGRFADATAGRLPQIGGGTTAVAAVDVDGDGDLDLVLARARERSRLYVNDGAARFTDATDARLPAQVWASRAVAWGDVDGDADPDLVLANQGEPNRLLLNDGTGRFTDASAGRLPADDDASLAVALGDLDGDGAVDLLVGNAPDGASSSGADRSFRNDGTGRFVEIALPRNGDRTGALVLGDVDGDLDLDLVAGNASNDGQQNRLYLNDGRARFVAADEPLLLPNRPGLGEFADADGDSDLDLFVFGGRGDRVLFNDGGGRLLETARSVLASGSELTVARVCFDADGDGDVDVAVFKSRHGVALLLNDGTGQFTDVSATHVPTTAGIGLGLAAGDVDGDGDADLAVGVWGRNWLFVNDGKGRFADVTAGQMPAGAGLTNAVALCDVDGDGDLDLVAVHGSDQERDTLYVNDGAGRFTDETSARLPASFAWSSSVAAGDVDGDGDVDLVLGTDGRQDRLWINDGSGRFADETQARMPVDLDPTIDVRLLDVDEDCDLDLVLVDSGPPGWRDRCYLNDGGGHFTDATRDRLPDRSVLGSTVAAGDVDGDGDCDLFFRDRIAVNRLRQVAAPWLPKLGASYRVELSAEPGFARLFHVGIPLFAAAAGRTVLPPYGTLGLDPASLVQLAPLYLPPGAGRASVDVPVPADVGLLGGLLFVQALIVPADRPARFTNVLAERIVD